MGNITILYDSRNNTIIKDNITKYIWLYSYRKPIAYLDSNFKIHILDKSKLTQSDKLHFSNFKKFIEKLLDK